MKTFLSLFTLVLIIATSSCKKNQDTSPQPIGFIQFAKEGLNYIQLPLNRTFFYRDSASGQLFQVRVTESSLGKRLHQSTGSFMDYTYNYEELSLELTKFDGTSQISWYKINAQPFALYGTSNSSAAIDPCGSDEFLNYGVGCNLGFWYPYDSTNYKTSLSIEGKTYNDVLEFTYGNGMDSTQSSYIMKAYYWAKGIGIIKRTVKTKFEVTTCNLVRYENYYRLLCLHTNLI